MDPDTALELQIEAYRHMTGEGRLEGNFSRDAERRTTL